jgi:hypothetical protein
VRTVDLLANAEALGVAFWLDGNRVRFNPASSLPTDLLAALKERRQEVAALLLRCWPPESEDTVRRFGRPWARLYPFLNGPVSTTMGPGRLLAVLGDWPGASVVLDHDPSRAVFIPWGEVRPPQ